MEKGQIVTTEIIDVTQDGQAVGKVEDIIVFIKGDLVLGDVCSAEITKVKKSFMIAEMNELIEASKYRTESFCEYGGVCGGCYFHKTSEEGELIAKTKWVKDKLIRIAGIENPKVNPIISKEEGRFNYRNKCVLQIDNKVNKKGVGEIKVGFFQKRSRNVVDCRVCQIQSEAAQIVAREIRGLASVLANGIKRATIKTSEANSGVMVDFEVTDYKASKKKKDEAIGFLGNPELVVESIYEALAEEGFNLESVFVNGEVCAAGNVVIQERIGSRDFEISPNSFYQINTPMAKELFDVAKGYADVKEGETILDLYCGVGTIGLYIKEKSNPLYGIEIVKDAVINANRNAVINGETNAHFYTGKAEDILAGIILGDEAKFDSRIGKENAANIKEASVIIIDPPRAGCDKDLIEAISEHKAKKLIYISCDPGTLARDIKLLKDGGYEFVEATPVDMFPGTGHIECVVLMSKVDK